MRLPLLLLFMLPSLLFADGYYTSNAIGQTRDSIPMLSGIGYEVEERGSEKLLYFDGEVLRSEVREDDKLITKEGDKQSELIFKDGVVVTERISEGDSVTVIDYEYSDKGILNKMVRTANGVLQDVTIYSYDPSTFLSAVSENDATSYVATSSYAYPEDGNLVMVTVYPSFLKRDESSTYSPHSSEVTEEGNLILTEKRGDDTLESIYSASGKLISEKLVSEDETLISASFYNWQGESLISMEAREGDENVETFYEGGKPLYALYYTSGALEKRRDYLPSGMIDELVYRDGEPYALIHYDADGKRVLGLEMM